nr:barstar family protein [Massilia sp. JS1662]
MKITIDGADIKSEADFHSALASALNLSLYYGKNLAALWDVLSTDVERPVTLTWKNWQLSKTYLAENFDRIMVVLKRVESQDADWGLEERFNVKLD